MTLKFELDLDFLTTHLTTKFHHPMFNRSELIVLTNTQANKSPNKEVLLKTSTSFRYATPLENKTGTEARV